MRLTDKGLEVRIIKEPEFVYTKDGRAVWKALAILSKRMQVGKRWENDPDYAKTWVHIVVFGDLAEELADREVEAGSIIVVKEGRFVPDKREGSFSIIAESLTISSGKGKEKRKGPPPKGKAKPSKVRHVEEDEEEEDDDYEEERPARRRRPRRRFEEDEFPDEADLPL